MSLISFIMGREKPVDLGSVENISHPLDSFVVGIGFPIFFIASF